MAVLSENGHGNHLLMDEETLERIINFLEMNKGNIDDNREMVSCCSCFTTGVPIVSATLATSTFVTAFAKVQNGENPCNHPSFALVIV